MQNVLTVSMFLCFPSDTVMLPHKCLHCLQKESLFMLKYGMKKSFAPEKIPSEAI